MLSYLLADYRDEHGIHAETLLNAIGALAGFSTQIVVRRGVLEPAGIPVERALAVLTGKDGRRYYFGEALNLLLASEEKGTLSLWRFVAAPACEAGLDIPDLRPLFREIAATAGGEEFGIPSMARKRRLREFPLDALRSHWWAVQSVLERNEIEPKRWSIVLGTAAQQLIALVSPLLPPDVGALIVMESAIMMSKVDPREVPGACRESDSPGASVAA
ncbi:hypothetical protein [Afifella sp. IM 167]|uniref:hypothetical protein n=1 Tax=Afifella sp. IM 167 TaxID=2033586 RepID=UPI001CCD40AC|nr:hypothetical protein [Afifella sp. IM 167]MBZ8134571.1 hypothetical protein [Afifella sp. IM 167]